MNEKQLRDSVSLPTLDTRRADGISEVEIFRLVDSASAWLQGLYPALATRLRRDLFAAIDQPSADNWDAVFDAPITRVGDPHPPQLIWSLVLAYTSYDIGHHFQGEAWPSVPSGPQLFLALSTYLGPTTELAPDSRDLF